MVGEYAWQGGDETRTAYEWKKKHSQWPFRFNVQPPALAAVTHICESVVQTLGSVPRKRGLRGGTWGDYSLNLPLYLALSSPLISLHVTS